MANTITLVIKVDASGATEFQQFGKDAKDGMDNAGDGQEEFAKRSEAMGRRVGLALAVAGAAILALGVSSIKAAAEFDTSMREVNTLLDLPLERFKELKQSVIDLDPALGSTSDLVGGLYQTISAGIGNADDLGTSLDFIGLAATAAKAGLADVDTAVLAGSKTLKGFNLEATESARVFDVMFQTVRQGQTNFQELASVAGDLATTSGVLNIELEETFGTLAELSLSAGSTAQAATQLDGIMRALIKPTETMQAAMEGLGFANAETLIESQGLEGALRSIIGTTDGTTISIGKLFSRAEGLRGVLSLMQDDFSGVSTQIAGMADASGAAATAFAEIEKSAGEQFEQLRNRIERLAIVIGDELLPFVLKLVDGISFLVDAFMNLGSTGRTIVVALTGIAGVVATIAGAFLALAGPIGSVVGLFGGLGTAAGAGGALSVGLLGTAVAIGGIGIALGLVAAAIISFLSREGGLIEEYWASGAASVSELVGGVSDLGAEMERLRPSIDAVNAIAGQFKDTVPEITAAIRDGVVEGQAYDDILIGLFDQFEAGTVAGDALRLKMAELNGEYAEVSFAAAEVERVIRELEQAEIDEAEAARLAAVAQAELDAALSQFGFTTLPQVVGEVEALSLIVGNAELPTEQLRAKVEELEKKYRDLGLLTPEVAAGLDEITAAMDRQDQAAGRLIPTTGENAAVALDMNAIFAMTPPAADNIALAFDFLTKTYGLNEVAVLAIMNTTSDFNDQIQLARALAGELTPELREVAQEMTGLDQETQKANKSTFDFFGGIFNGIPILGELGKGFDFVVGKMNDFVSQGTDFLQEKLGGLFAPGSKLGSFLSDGLGQAVGLAIPFIGPLIAPFLGQIAGFLGKGVAAIGGFFSGLFGGVSAAEQEGRSAAAAFRDSIRAELSAGVLADVQLAFPNDVQNAAFLASIQEKLVASGVAAEAASIQAQQWGTALFEAEQQGGAAVEAVIAQIDAATQAAVADTATATQAAVDSTQTATDAVGTAAAEQCAATNAAAACGVADAQKVTDAVVAGSTTQTEAVVQASSAQTATVQGAAAEQAAAVQTAAIDARTAWEESTSAQQATVQAATAAMTSTIIAESQTQAAAVQDFGTSASATFDEYKLNARVTSDAVSTTMVAGIGRVAFELNSLASEAGGAFQFIEDSAGAAAQSAVDSFSTMRTQLTGMSEFPDMADEASADLARIGDAAEFEANRSTSAFADFAGNTTKRIEEIKAKLMSGMFEGDERARLDRELDVLEAGRRQVGGGDADERRRRRRDRDRSGGSDFRPRPDSEGDRRRHRGQGGGDGFATRPRGGDGLLGGGGGGGSTTINIGPVNVNGVLDPKKTADMLLKEIGRRAALKGIRVSAVV